MKVLFIGDIFGKPGRQSVQKYLKQIKKSKNIDFVIANAENTAHGKGLTAKHYQYYMDCGIDFITMGNHTWFRDDIFDLLETKANIIRPLNLSTNFKHHNVGVGTRVVLHNNKQIRITNLLGNSVRFKEYQTNCFQVFKDLLDSTEVADIHIVDFHSETSSEKNAFLWAFDGKISAVLGTHTHIPTADGCITENKTAYVGDVGMTGPSKGVIGGKKDEIIKKFFDPNTNFILDVESGPVQFCAAIIEFDDVTNFPIGLEQVVIREGFESVSKINQEI